MEYNISVLPNNACTICQSISTQGKSNINFQRHATPQIKCYIHKITAGQQISRRIEWYHKQRDLTQNGDIANERFLISSE